jgi:hypothetical protein
MSYGITIKVDDQASGGLKAVSDAFKAGRHKPVVARAAANEIKENFRKLNRRRHRPAARFQFYARAADGTSSGVSGGNAFVSIDHEGIALRRFGGTVRPRKGKWLTLPVDPSAVGRRVREFGKVQFVINPRTQKGVVLQQGRVLYALVKSTTHKPDPSVLPTEANIQKSVNQALNIFTDNLKDRSRG